MPSLRLAETSGERLPDASPVVIVGGGNCAHALGVHLAGRGLSVHMLVRNLDRIPPSTRSGFLNATGRVQGRFPLAAVSQDPAQVLEQAQTLFIATVADAYPEVARRLAPHLQPGQRVVLFSSKLAGCVAFEHVLHLEGVRGVRVAETDALFASRLQPDGSIQIRGIKRWNLVSTPRRSQTVEALDFLSGLFEGLEAADHVIQRGLTDFGALAHPLTMLANLNQVDRKQPFLFYCDGFTERTVVLLETLEQEFRQVARAYQTNLLPASTWLDRYYGCAPGSLLEAMRSVPNYQTSVAPDSLTHRYLQEDVACTLVPMRALARLAGVSTPVADAVVALTSALHAVDYDREGRTLESLGWAGLAPEQILSRLAA